MEESPKEYCHRFLTRWSPASHLDASHLAASTPLYSILLYLTLSYSVLLCSALFLARDSHPNMRDPELLEVLDPRNGLSWTNSSTNIVSNGTLYTVYTVHSTQYTISLHLLTPHKRGDRREQGTRKIPI